MTAEICQQNQAHDRGALDAFCQRDGGEPAGRLRRTSGSSRAALDAHSEQVQHPWALRCQKSFGFCRVPAWAAGTGL